MKGLRDLRKVLRGAGHHPETLAFRDGTRLLVLPHGGRLLGVFAAGSEENFYWTNPALDSVASAKAFFAGAAWPNSGGDRTWLAPEVDVFLPKFPDLGAYDQPRSLDPGNYRVGRDNGSLLLENKLKLRLSRSGGKVDLKIVKSFGPSPDPLRYERDLDLEGVSYAGYTQFTSLAFAGGRVPAGAQLGLWNLIQMPHGGELLLPTFSRSQPLHIFSTVGRIPKSAVRIGEHLIRYRMDQRGEHKLSFRAAAMAGRAAYIHGAGKDWSLVVRNFGVNPSGEYVDVPWNDPDWRGFAVQACNVCSGLGAFSELEYHIPGIGAGTGLSSCEDHAQVWAYRGPKDPILAVARRLVAGSDFRMGATAGGFWFLCEIVIKARKTNPQKLTWLMEADELGPRLSDAAPIFVKFFEQKTAAEAPGPARHPYCEINVALKGEGVVMVEGEETRRAVNDVMLLGPGVPHWGKVTRYPHRAITVYFLPSALLEFCNPQVSVSILRRFSAPRSLGERLVRLPPDMHRALVRGLSEIHEEFRSRGFGWELRVGAILFSEIVRLMRWEASRGAQLGEDNSDVDWRPVVQALRYLRENYAGQVYAADVAQAAGISETRLKLVFRRAVGMPWVKYLQIYRTHRAALLLCEGRMNVTEVALVVGFESLSHFNSTFRAIMGQTPSKYAQQNHRLQTGRVKRSLRRRR